jgi:hypothetical protein
MIGRVVKEVGVANVSDFEQRSTISAETSRDGPAVLRSQGAGADIRFVFTSVARALLAFTKRSD